MELSTPQSMLDRYNELCNIRNDIRVLNWIMGNESSLEWINSVGVCQDEILKNLAPPIPPLEIRKIVASPEPEIFLWTGYIDCRQILKLASQYSCGDNLKILDFGCGCGRMIRYLPGAYGCDINPDLVAWCQKNLADADTRLNGVKPPLPYDDESFDLIYSLSIFTHLPEYLSKTWEKELRRILKPEGILILTTHGIPALEIIRESRVHQELFQMNSLEANSMLQNFEKEPYVFRKYATDTLKVAKAGPEYGNAFIHPTYMKQIWDNDHFSLESHLSGGLRGWQDIVILKPK